MLQPLPMFQHHVFGAIDLLEVPRFRCRHHLGVPVAAEQKNILSRSFLTTIVFNEKYLIPVGRFLEFTGLETRDFASLFKPVAQVLNPSVGPRQNQDCQNQDGE